ncbi:hypothetical protein [Streptomyces sp. NPDC088816]|uniref:hypothetical protein n=1 Tax=Streptomyces sp. NPDC088816 TaxID=3365906 RepID=UPI00380F7DF7
MIQRYADVLAEVRRNFDKRIPPEGNAGIGPASLDPTEFQAAALVYLERYLSGRVSMAQLRPSSQSVQLAQLRSDRAHVSAELKGLMNHAFAQRKKALRAAAPSQDREAAVVHVVRAVRPHLFHSALAELMAAESRKPVALTPDEADPWAWATQNGWGFWQASSPKASQLTRLSPSAFINALVRDAAAKVPNPYFFHDAVLKKHAWLGGQALSKMDKNIRRLAQQGASVEALVEAHEQASLLTAGTWLARAALACLHRRNIVLTGDEEFRAVQKHFMGKAAAQIFGREPNLELPVRRFVEEHWLQPICQPGHSGHGSPACLEGIVRHFRAQNGKASSAATVSRPVVPAQPVAPPAVMQPAPLKRDRYAWQTVLEQVHLEAERLPLPPVLTAAMADMTQHLSRIAVTVSHAGQELPREYERHRPRFMLKPDETTASLDGIEWPVEFFPGLRLHCSWSRADNSISIGSLQLAKPVEIDDITVRHEYDPKTYTRQAGLAEPSRSEHQPTALRRLVLRTVRQLGLLDERGCARLQRNDLVRDIVEVAEELDMAQWLSPHLADLSATVDEMIKWGELSRDTGSVHPSGDLHYPPRPGERRVDLLCYIPKVNRVFERPATRHPTGWQVQRLVGGHLRRIDGDARPTAEEELQEEQRSKGMPVTPLAPGHTFVRSYHTHGDRRRR